MKVSSLQISRAPTHLTEYNMLGPTGTFNFSFHSNMMIPLHLLNEHGLK